MQQPFSARDVTDPDPHAGQDMDARGGFAGALAAVADVEGWMTDAQAGVLWDRAAAWVRLVTADRPANSTRHA